MRRVLGGWMVMVSLVAFGGAADARGEPHRVTHLAGRTTAFHRPALRTYDDLRAMMRGRLPDVRAVLEQEGWQGDLQDLMAAITSGGIHDVQIQVGDAIPWMAMRDHGRPSVLRKPEGMVWGGRAPVESYAVEFASKGWTWTLMVPKICGNFWITGRQAPVAEAPAPTVGLSAEGVCVSQPVPASVTVSGALAGDVLALSVDGRQVESFPATNGTTTRPLAGLAVGSHRIEAQIARGDARASAQATVRACPPECALSVTPTEVRRGKAVLLDASGSHPATGVQATLQGVSVEVRRDGTMVETVTLPGGSLRRELPLADTGSYEFHAVATDSLGQKSEGPCGAHAVATRPPLLPFAAAFFGKERMVREDFGGGHCAPLIGVKGGLLIGFGGGRGELEAAVGGKIDLSEGGDSSIFADLAVNRVTRRAFVGAGISFWDITIDDTRGVSGLIHGGVDLDGRGRVSLAVEGRLPFDRLDDIENNYQFWGGLRIRPAK